MWKLRRVKMLARHMNLVSLTETKCNCIVKSGCFLLLAGHLIVKRGENMKLVILFLGLTFIVFTSNAVIASCICTCINGQNQPLCSSSIDIRPICPPKVCPIEPPSIAPIMRPVVPPIGTSNCWNEQVLNPYSGRYEWQEVCN